ncbi:MAG: DUF4393 domain-containing protein [Meiothermus sp.]|nr:DUF4393 domain-containing protein [Meiothermus sp.]
MPEDPKEKSGLILEIYRDVGQPSARQIGQSLGGVLGMIMLPLKLIGYKADQWESQFIESLERKTESIPLEKLIPPNPTVTGPILQALSYTVHEDDLREMFTSLLATAMNSDTASDAHPALVDVIKQMNSDEAKIMNFLASSGMATQPICDLLLVGQDVFSEGVTNNTSALPVGYSLIERNKSFIAEDASCEHPNLGASYIDNLCRLGLLEIRNARFGNDDRYDRLRSWSKSIVLADDPLFLEGKRGIELSRKTIQLTDFGQLFVRTCISLNV